MPGRRRYLNFTTPAGINLAAVAHSGFSSLLIHETGFLPDLRGWNHEGVDSPFWRFYHNPRPGCFIRHQGADIPLDASRVVLVPANTLFDCCGPVAAAHLWVHFTVTRPGLADLGAPVALPVDGVFHQLLGEAVTLHGEPAGDARDQKLFHTAAALLHVAFSRLDTEPAHRLPAPLAALMDAIHTTPGADFSNTVMARRLGMGVEKFIRWFRQQTGETPAAYVAAARIRLAKEALALSDQTIDQIASAHGFPNRHYFSRVFSRQVGCGPAEFRSRQKVRKGL